MILRPAARPWRRHGQTLIASLIVVAILIILYLQFLGPRVDRSGQIRPGVAKASIDKSKEVELRTNLQQIRSVVMMYQNENDGRNPATLEELKTYSKLPASFWTNPVDGSALSYDPASGRVWSDSPLYRNF